MKKKVSLLLFLLTFSFALGELKDVQGMGEYESYRKLEGHEYEGKFDIYFQLINNEGKPEEKIVINPLYPNVNLEEVLTISFSNGDVLTQPRKIWYYVFQKERYNNEVVTFLKKEASELYNEWIDLTYDISAKRMAQTYIKKSYYSKVGLEPVKFNSEQMKDIAGTGEYKTYRKLIGHEYEEKFEIYFFVVNNNGNVGESIQIKRLYPNVDLEENVTVTLANGEKRIASRKNWYIIFNKLHSDSPLWSTLSKTELYDEWANLSYTTEVERMVKKYIKEVYYPKLGIEP